QGHFDRYPFSKKKIDLIFSDFIHGPLDILRIFAQFAPRMSDSSSIFIDSAPTLWQSHLLLEQLVSSLNRGRIPHAMRGWLSEKSCDIILSRTYQLIPLTIPNRSHQNSTAWIKIAPSDLFPHPLAPMRM